MKLLYVLKQNKINSGGSARKESLLNAKQLSKRERERSVVEGERGERDRARVSACEW